MPDRPCVNVQHGTCKGDGIMLMSSWECGECYDARRGAEESKRKADAQRLADLDTLDAHVRTLPGGSYWSSSGDTCGVVDASDPENNWHRHGRDENDARHEAAEHIRQTPRCDWVSGWGNRCKLLAGHPGEGHLVDAG